MSKNECIKINHIYNDDCVNIIKNIKDNDVDLIVTDPPYGVEYDNNKLYNDSKNHVFSKDHINLWLSEMCRVLKQGSHIYIFIPTLEVDKWVYNVKKYFEFKNIITTQTYTSNRYLKNNFSFISQFVIFASKGKSKPLNKIDFIKTSNSWLKDKRNNNPKEYTYQYPNFIQDIRANIKPNRQLKLQHPNSKSIDLCEKFILLSSNENDIVLDPFAGSGNILKAAKNVNRNYVGIEQSKEIFDKIKI